jgi:hypothetical protein
MADITVKITITWAGVEPSLAYFDSDLMCTIGKRFQSTSTIEYTLSFQEAIANFTKIQTNPDVAVLLYAKGKQYRKERTDKAKSRNWGVNFQTYILVNLQVLSTLCY